MRLYSICRNRRGGIIGGGISVVGMMLATGGDGVGENGYPPCNQVPFNRTNAQCVSTLPSAEWLAVCSQLGAMRKRSKKSCVPGCHWNIQDGKGVFPTASNKEKTLPQEELIRFHEWEVNEYAYAVCENQPDSWLHHVKSFFSNHSIPYWTTKTSPSVVWGEGPRGLVEYPTEGLVYPKEYSGLVYDEELYNSEIVDNADIAPCFKHYGLECVGGLYD